MYIDLTHHEHKGMHYMYITQAIRTQFVRQEFSGKVYASQLEGWVFDPQPLSELP